MTSEFHLRIGFLAAVVAFALAVPGLAAPPAPAAAAPAAPTGDQLTADELYPKALREYNAGKFAEAVASFRKYEADFGSSPQTQTVMAAIRYPLAMSLLQLQKFDEALEVIDACLKATPAPSGLQKEDLMFYKGVCQMQAEDQLGARESLQQFWKAFPASREAPEAALLYGTSFLIEEKWAEAATQFAAIRPKLGAVNRGRATVLQLYALMQEEKFDEALALVLAEYPRMNQMLQIATFQTLAMKLGSEFLEKGQYRKAIAALQRIWNSERLVKYQGQRLTEIDAALAAAEAQPNGDPYHKFQLKQMKAKVERELANLEKIPSFNSALRLRLATAYQAMQRHREAALIMEDMLDNMPLDSVVESASLGLVQSWSAIERWPKVIESAQTFEKKFPNAKDLPMVLYLEGIAQQKLNDQAAAIATFEGIRKRFPTSSFAKRALFMKGFSQLLADKNKEAIQTFEEFPKTYPKADLAETAAYWRGMAYSLDKQFPASRDAMDAYLDQYKNGSYRGLAVFRKAYGAQSLRDYKKSIVELQDYLQKYPGHESNDEALVLLGDALMDQGDIEEGIAAFKKINPENTKFFEEGWFKIGKAYRLLEQTDEMRKHFEQFVTEHSRSPRVAEAIYWVGWTYTQSNEPDKARDAYWTAIATYGNDATIRSVDDLFPALQKLYGGEEDQLKYVARLRDLRETADNEKKTTLAMRALWAQAILYKKSDPDRARNLLVDAATRVNVSTTSPLLLADFARALGQAGRADAAERMWLDLVKWNPRAAQKDDAFASLGMLAAKRGNEQAALGYFDRFEKETFGSAIFGKVMLAKANILLARGSSDAARKTLDSLLKSPYASSAEKAEALYITGDLYMQEKDYTKAIAYFQRIYTVYGRWRTWVAKAYLDSGEAFEKLNDLIAARNTYAEMISLDELQSLPETAKAKERLQALGGPVPVKPS